MRMLFGAVLAIVTGLTTLGAEEEPLFLQEVVTTGGSFSNTRDGMGQRVADQFNLIGMTFVDRLQT